VERLLLQADFWINRVGKLIPKVERNLQFCTESPVERSYELVIQLAVFGVGVGENVIQATSPWELCRYDKPIVTISLLTLHRGVPKMAGCLAAVDRRQLP
jgi:hypothetical protein